MWPFDKGPSKAQLRLAVAMYEADLKDYQRLYDRAVKDRKALKFNLAQLQKEQSGNGPTGGQVVIGLPQGYDPRDDLPTDVVALQTRLDQAKAAYAQAMSAYDDLDNDAAKTFEQMGTKLATALNLLTPAGKKKYAKLLAGMGWGDPINYEKDTV